MKNSTSKQKFQYLLYTLPVGHEVVTEGHGVDL